VVQCFADELDVHLSGFADSFSPAIAFAALEGNRRPL
jgi:hypothetical protein